MKVSELFIFRHGETDWNQEKRLQGHTNIPLNSRGVEQAEVLRKNIEKCQPQAIITSDLIRAKTTAEIVNRQIKVPIFESANLRECFLGDAEGMFKQELIEIYGQSTWQKWLSVRKEDNEFRFPNGESITAHIQRLRNYMQSFCKRNSDFNKIAVSTHGGCVLRLIYQCEDAPTDGMSIPNCGLYKILFHHVDLKWYYGGRLTT